MDTETLSWLLDVGNPGVRVRTLTGLCGAPQDSPEEQEAKKAVLAWLPAAQDPNGMNAEGLKLLYLPVALAECGLTRADIDISPVVERLLANNFDSACGDMIALRALVMLGYQDDPRVMARLEAMNE